MRIIFLSHFYPPWPCGGAGVYIATLAEALRWSGVDSRVLCVGDWDKGKKHFNGYTEDVYNDVPVRRLHVNWTKAPRPFDYIFDNPILAQNIQGYLEDTRPDLVHVISCYTLSAQAIIIPKILDIPTVVHLVDMWFICPRHTLLREDGTLCYGSQGDWDCQRCMLWGSKAYRWSGKILNDDQQRVFFRQLAKVSFVTRMPGFRGMLSDMGRRRQLVLNALLQADVLIAPSRTLQGLYEANGVPQGYIQYIPYGHSTAWAKDVKKNSSEVIRFGFLGNVLPLKGVHVLVEAFQQLEWNGQAELHIYGYDLANPAYTKELRQQSGPGVFWHGEYAHTDLPQIFSQIDVVVVPSIWHENNPLVIQEAFAASCPVICSDVGGAAESVRDGIDGLHFRTGDAGDLARQMRSLLTNRDLLKRLCDDIRPVRTIEEELAEIQAIYQEIL